MDLAIASALESGVTAPNKMKMLHELWTALNLQHGIVGVIGDIGKPLEAGILLRIEPMWYSDDDKMHLVERTVFVHPDFRSAKGGRAAKLCEFAKNTSDRLNMPLMIGVLSTQKTEAKVRLYRRKFGEPSGAYWIYNGATGSENWGG
jgi:hypothetical protein